MTSIRPRKHVEALLHSPGEVLGKEGSLFRVRVRREIWNAELKDNLQPGDCVEVVAVEELRLRVCPYSRDQT
jgi:membrane protein implicated in regulation of membrane protease activity